MEQILEQIVDILVGGIGGIAEGIGTGLTTLVQNVFLTQSAEGGAMELSVFGGIVIVFAGISLSLGLSHLVVRWITSLGASRGM